MKVHFNMLRYSASIILFLYNLSYPYPIDRLERCNSTHPTCGTLRQVNIPRPGENVTLEFSPAQNLIENPSRIVTYWINKTSNDYVGFGVNTLTLENVSKWMRGEEYYVQCTADMLFKKCTQTVALQIKGRPFHL